MQSFLFGANGFIVEDDKLGTQRLERDYELEIKHSEIKQISSKEVPYSDSIIPLLGQASYLKTIDPISGAELSDVQPMFLFLHF